jgi:hypothetical protein
MLVIMATVTTVMTGPILQRLLPRMRPGVVTGMTRQAAHSTEA